MAIKLLVACPWGSTSSPQTLSGIPFYLIPELSKFDINIEVTELEKIPNSRKSLMHNVFSRYFPQYRRKFVGSNLALAKKLSVWLTGQIDYYKPTALLTFGLAPLVYLKPKCPVYLYLDAVYAYKPTVYQWINYVSKKELLDIQFIDKQALSKATIAMFTTKSIANAASSIYGEFKSKIVDVGIGANFYPKVLQPKSRDGNETKIDLLCMYSSFERKGVEIAIKTAYKLVDKGYIVTLHAVGPKPPDSSRYSSAQQSLFSLKFYDWIDKSTLEGRELLYLIFQTCHIHLLPTLGDLSPHTICEANAFGIPTVAHNIGGIGDLVDNKKNGVLIESLDPLDYVNGIIQVLNDFQRYSRSAQEIYKEKQNWKFVSNNIYTIISESILR